MNCRPAGKRDCAGIYLRWDAARCFARVLRSVRRELRETGYASVRVASGVTVVGAWEHERGAFIARAVPEPERTPRDAWAPRCAEVRP